MILLAFHTAVLSCIPCQDEAFGDSSVDTVVLIKAVAGDQEGSEDLDLCSPFCSCTCCASVSVQNHIAYLPVKASFFIFKEITFLYLPNTHACDLTSIWQPPRA